MPPSFPLLLYIYIYIYLNGALFIHLPFLLHPLSLPSRHRMLFLYYDKDADGSTKTDCDGHKANWFISQTRPSETATEDLDGDGTCNYEVRCTRSLCPFARVPVCPCALVPVCPVAVAVFRVSKTGHPRTFVRRKRPLNGPRERHAFTDTCQTTMNFTTFVCNKQKKGSYFGRGRADTASIGIVEGVRQHPTGIYFILEDPDRSATSLGGRSAAVPLASPLKLHCVFVC